MEASIFKMAANVQEEKEKLKPTMEMKRRAVNYYNKNNVPKCLESLLNTMFLEEPEDIYGYMVKYHRKKIPKKGLFCLYKLRNAHHIIIPIIHCMRRSNFEKCCKMNRLSSFLYSVLRVICNCWNNFKKTILASPRSC